jgi:hypothetical protein
MPLNRDQILNSVDIQVKEIQVPEWGGSVFIRQLTRAEQDEYLKRQYGDTRLKQDNRAKQQEISSVNIYGHDAYLCVCGICDEDGKQLFKQNDIDALKKKNGSVVGRIAVEIVKFSSMENDVTVEEEVKN